MKGEQIRSREILYHPSTYGTRSVPTTLEEQNTCATKQLNPLWQECPPAIF